MTLTRKINGGRRTRCKTLSKKKCLKRKTCTLSKKSRKCSKRRKTHRGGAQKNNRFTLSLKATKNDIPLNNVSALPPSVKSSFMKYFKSEGEYEDDKFRYVAEPDEIKSIDFKGKYIKIKGETDKPLDDGDPDGFARQVRYMRNEGLGEFTVEHDGDSYGCRELKIV